jgi:hypothetical protein
MPVFLLSSLQALRPVLGAHKGNRCVHHSPPYYSLSSLQALVRELDEARQKLERREREAREAQAAAKAAEAQAAAEAANKVRDSGCGAAEGFLLRWWLAALAFHHSSACHRIAQPIFPAPPCPPCLQVHAAEAAQKKAESELVQMRAREAALYLTPEPDAPPQQLPQAVAAESSLAASPIAQVGAMTTTTGGALGLARLGEHVGPVSTMVSTARGWADSLGMQLLTVLAGALVIGGAVVMVQRYKQRSGGWA